MKDNHLKLLSLIIACVVVFSFPVVTAKDDSYDLIIITPSIFVHELQKFVEYKEKHDIKTKVVDLTEIYNNRYFKCTGCDEPEKIKYFIKEAYDNWNIKYVLLVGSSDLLPVRYSHLNDRSSTWEYERKIISDLYYADIYDKNGSFSSWDSNGNGYYGEYDHEIGDKKYTDEVELTPEVAIGRFACRNIFELKNVIKKIISYESGSATENILLACGDSYPNDPCGDIPEGQYLGDAIADEMDGFKVTKLYPPKNAMQINREINRGVDLVVFEGAGGHHLWATHEYNKEKWVYYRKLNIKLLFNQKYSIVFTSGARLAKFDEKKECFNWAFVGCKHGAVASIGSTGLCWTAHGKNVTEFYLGNLHLRLVQEYKDAFYIGDMWRDAITSYLKSFDWRGNVEKGFHIKAAEELELFGDPSMKINKEYEQTGENHNIKTEIDNFGGYNTEIDSMSICKRTGSMHSITDIPNESKTLYVGGSGPGNYTKIQDAVDDARSGYTIIVFNGTYYENVIVNKELNIVSKNATLIGHFDLYSNSVLDGFIINGENYSVRCRHPEVEIRNNKMSAYYGLILDNASNTRVYGNSFKCMYAVFIEKSPSCIVYKNTFSNNWYGVWVEYSNFLTIKDNNFSSNRWYTVWLDRCDNSTIENNSFYKNWYSIFLYHTDDCIVKRNNIIHNEHGPQIVASSRNILKNNNIFFNEHYGVYTGNMSKKNQIVSNNIVDNAYNARDDDKNMWDGNYWSDYIGLKFRILQFIGFPYRLKKSNFDWHPAVHQIEW